MWFIRVFPDFRIFCDQNLRNFIDFQPDFVCFSSILRYFSGIFITFRIFHEKLITPLKAWTSWLDNGILILKKVNSWHLRLVYILYSILYSKFIGNGRVNDNHSKTCVPGPILFYQDQSILMPISLFLMVLVRKHCPLMIWGSYQCTWQRAYVFGMHDSMVPVHHEADVYLSFFMKLEYIISYCRVFVWPIIYFLHPGTDPGIFNM